MDTCPTPVDFERRASGVMPRDEGERFDRHLTACPPCRSAYQSFMRDNQFLAQAKGILEGSNLSDQNDTLAVTPSSSTLPRDTAAHSLPLEVEASSPPSVGREYLPRIEGYEVMGVLGRGGMGVVYEAVQKKLNRRVALKLLPALISSANPDVVTRFKREATAAAMLHHTNIIPIYDFGESRDGYFYAMELIEGQPLSVLVKRLAALDAPMAAPTTLAAVLHRGDGPTSATSAPPAEPTSSGFGTSTTGRGRPYYLQVARWIADVADALHYAHLHGLIHRDIKPSNLMVCTDGRIVVLDFGLVKGAGDRSVTMTGSLVGTYRYMSPEQVGAKRITLDARTDIYSLGATLYELLTFQPAFTAVEQSDLLSHILFKDPTPPRKIIPTVPVDLQTICLKALEKAPNSRYQTARALADDLRQYLADRPIVARPLGIVGRTTKYVRRHRAASITVLSLLLLTAAVAVGVWNENRRKQERLDKIEWMLTNGRAHQTAQKWMEAESAYDEVLALDQNNFPALVNLATVKKDQYYIRPDAQLLRDAEELLNRAQRVEPNRVEPWNLRGLIHRAEGRLDDAIRAYEKARSLDPTYYAAWVNLGALYAAQGNLSRAEEFLLKSTELPTGAKAAQAWRHLGAVRMQLGRPEAADAVEAALALDGADVPSLLLKVRLLLRPDSIDSAKEALKRADFADSLTESDRREARGSGKPDPFLAWVKRVLAMAYLRRQEWNDAIAAAESALQFGDPVPAYAHLVLAIAESKRGDAAASKRRYDDAIAAWPHDLEKAGFKAQLEGKVLWIDSAEELLRLRQEAEALRGLTP